MPDLYGKQGSEDEVREWRNVVDCLQNRFENIDAYEFEDFVLRLMQKLGYKGWLTPKSGDFGVDVIAEKDKSRLAIQAKKYSSQNMVSVKDVNQLAGGAKYWECAGSLLVTTSALSGNAKLLCEKLKIDYWEKKELIREVNAAYFRGVSYIEFFPLISESKGYGVLDFSLWSLTRYNKMESGDECDILVFRVKNECNHDLDVDFDLPVLFFEGGLQVDVVGFYYGKFSIGTLYALATVEVGIVVESKNIDSVGGYGVLRKVLFVYDLDGDKKKRYENPNIAENVRRIHEGRELFTDVHVTDFAKPGFGCSDAIAVGFLAIILFFVVAIVISTCQGG